MEGSGRGEPAQAKPTGYAGASRERKALRPRRPPPPTLQGAQGQTRRGRGIPKGSVRPGAPGGAEARGPQGSLQSADAQLKVPSRGQGAGGDRQTPPPPTAGPWTAKEGTAVCGHSASSGEGWHVVFDEKSSQSRNMTNAKCHQAEQMMASQPSDLCWLFSCRWQQARGC